MRNTLFANDTLVPRRVVAAVVAAVALVPVASATAATSPAASVGPPTATKSWTARVLLPTVAREKPSASAKVVRKVSPYGPYDNDPQSLLVLEAASSSTGTWYRVLLPVRPNGTSGWVNAVALQVAPTPLRVRVDLGDRTAEVLRAGKRLKKWKVGVGTSANPTPTGLFAISEIVPQNNPRGFFGPYILPLTAFSDTLTDFDRGKGQVAIHGTSLPGLLGQAVSHGCVRMSNAAITFVAKHVPRGAPVEITE